MVCDRNRLPQARQQDGLDILLATATENIYYLMGTESVNWRAGAS